MSTTSRPPQPQPQSPASDWEHRPLYDNVLKTLMVMPSRFKSELNITGVLATDLFTFNSSLGATIEQQVVDQLNELRELWDPDKRYADHQFIRQAQRFPDVILRRSADPNATPLMGIELKGWYILAKEGEPSFRYKVTPAACAPQDLLVVYPWALKSVTSGAPILYAPYIASARFAAEYRNWWWEFDRRSSGDSRIELSSVTTPYPRKDDPITDKPNYDGGDNFGRFSRSGAMEDFKKERFSEYLSGIPITAWQRFFKIFAESKTEDAAMVALERLAREFEVGAPGLKPATTREVGRRIGEIINLIRND